VARGCLAADTNNVITGVFFAVLALVMIAVWSAAVSFLSHRDELHVRFLVVRPLPSLEGGREGGREGGGEGGSEGGRG
jgi:hypothetical protein